MFGRPGAGDGRTNSGLRSKAGMSRERFNKASVGLLGLWDQGGEWNLERAYDRNIAAGLLNAGRIAGRRSPAVFRETAAGDSRPQDTDIINGCVLGRARATGLAARFGWNWR